MKKITVLALLLLVAACGPTYRYRPMTSMSLEEQKAAWECNAQAQAAYGSSNRPGNIASSWVAYDILHQVYGSCMLGKGINPYDK